jgi:hypothetical protein
VAASKLRLAAINPAANKFNRIQRPLASQRQFVPPP